MSKPRYVLIANPGTKRCDAFCRAVAGVSIVPWADVIRAGGNLDGFPAFDHPAIVRLESPGKDSRVTKLLCGVPEVTDLPKGILFRPAAWYEGFCHVLDGLHRSFAARPHLSPTACPLAIAAMFDKNRTLAMLQAADVIVPEFLPPNDIPRTAEDLILQLRAKQWPTTYVKLNTGASAVGIVVLRLSPTSEPTGETTLFQRDRQFFNTRHLRTIIGTPLHECLNFLLNEGATVQRGLPHAQLDGQNADLRVVCVRGRPIATIFRLSPHAITNLHLGGRRGNWERCRAAIPNRAWLDALDSCTAAANCFAATTVGVDVLFEPGFRRHAVLEVNAFGDFFPGWTDGAGRTIYDHELAVERDLRNPLNEIAPSPFES